MQQISGHKNTPGDCKQGKICPTDVICLFKRCLMSDDSKSHLRIWLYTCHSALLNTQPLWKLKTLKEKDLLYFKGKKLPSFISQLMRVICADQRSIEDPFIRQVYLFLLKKDVLHRRSFTCATTLPVPKFSSKYCSTKAVKHRKAGQWSFLQTALSYIQEEFPTL